MNKRDSKGRFKKKNSNIFITKVVNGAKKFIESPFKKGYK